MPTFRLAAAAALAAVPLATSATHALPSILQPLLEQCWGAVVTVCDPDASIPVELNSVGVPVCTGSCEVYNVPVPGHDGGPVCVTWSDHAGVQYGVCTDRLT